MNPSPPTTPRATSIDALRGYAILTMTLSSAIAFGILPAWMYHAQTPPPDHAFNPAVYGITWVDLVFPFFLFAMGAAFPFSLGKKIENGLAPWKLTASSLLRGGRLAFFAIFIQHMYPHIISRPTDCRAWLVSLAAFATLFFIFLRIPWKWPKWARITIELAGYAMAVVLLLTVDYAGDRTFRLGFSNIIILVLANMAVFASVVYSWTARNKWARLLPLPFIMAVMLGAVASPDSWNAWLYHYTPAPWLYSFRYLKYLFIVLPGSIAGDYIRQWIQTHKPAEPALLKREKITAVGLLLLSLGVIVCNLYGLFTRQLIVNLAVSTGIVAAGYVLLRQSATSFTVLWKQLWTFGACLLLLGLFFEAFEGGVRKDHSTFSYYFITSGLACMALIVFSVLCDYFQCRRSLSFLVMSGQNPMIAYVASSMVVVPLLSLARLTPWLDAYGANPWLGGLRGLIITALVTGLTMFFTKIKWFWRT
ncbi:MAG: DUF5009 domain-containing protein [Prevotellaceae bacterium]|jgi:predicted acyltransferase|nr:DUF5009 domain-containing protein [Prevotellaceae bacterium]